MKGNDGALVLVAVVSVMFVVLPLTGHLRRRHLTRRAEWDRALARHPGGSGLVPFQRDGGQDADCRPLDLYEDAAWRRIEQALAGDAEPSQ